MYQNLDISANFDLSDAKSLLGRGIVVKNINRDKTLVIGILGSPDDLV